MKDEILKLYREGLTYSEIQKELGCSKGTISYHCGDRIKSKKWRKHKYTREELLKAVELSGSIRQVLGILNLNVNSSSYTTIKYNLERYHISVDHFKGQAWAGGKKPYNELTKEEFITKYLKIGKEKTSSHTLKLRLYKYNLKKEECEECEVKKKWNGKPISLHLDHINGNNKDNRLDNLKILCPNCHSQTPTYAGKNIGNSK